MRRLRFGLCLVLSAAGLLPSDAFARSLPSAAARRWIESLVTKIDAADQAGSRQAGPRRERRMAGVVGLRVTVTADGSVLRAEVERSTGSAELDQRALTAVRAAAPFPAPPPELLMPGGTTELSFPLDLGR